jgi:signal transduction histidine kinase
MQPVDHLPSFFGTEALARITKAEQGTEKINGWIVAHASIDFAKRNPDIPGNWVIALAFPERSLFTSVFNLYLLYAVLSVALLATAVGGYAISRHLLEPLEELHHEASAIAAGDFSRRVAIRGNDEIGALGDQFNNMAERIDDLVKSLAAHRDRLEDEVKARTQDLEREQDKRRELDRQMFQTEKMATMGELAMGVAHEIGNPLAGMKAVVQSMQFKKDLPPSIRPPLQRLEAEIDRLTSFLRTFHGLAAPEITHREECLLVALLDDVLFWTRKEAQTRGVAIDCKGVDELPALWADPQQFRQILLNLVLNAIHAMPDGGHIAIRAHFEGDRARIEVADSGHGIPADVMPHIFDPFFTTRSNGTGLGLSIVRKIAEQHAARIDVDSEIGHGACFTLLWPLASVTM